MVGGVIDTSGHQVLPFEFTDVSLHTDRSLFIIEKDQKVGLYNALGNLLLATEYDEIKILSSCQTAIKNDSLWIFDINNELYFSAKASSIKLLEFPFVQIIEQDTLLGLYHKSFEINIKPIFKNIRKENSWWILSRRDSMVYVESATGQVVGTFGNTSLEPTVDNEVFVMKNRNGYGLFHQQRGIILEPKFKEFKIEKKQFIVFDGSFWSAYNLNGKNILKSEFNSLEIIDDKYFLARKEYFGLYNLDGSLLVSPDYERFQIYDDIIKGYIRKGVNVFVIDNGKVVSKQSYNNYNVIQFKQFTTSLRQPSFSSGWFLTDNKRPPNTYGFRNKNGKLIQMPIFRTIDEYPSVDLVVGRKAILLNRDDFPERFLFGISFQYGSFIGINSFSKGNAYHLPNYIHVSLADLINDNITYMSVINIDAKYDIISKYSNKKSKESYLFVDKYSNGFTRFCTNGRVKSVANPSNPYNVVRYTDYFRDKRQYLFINPLINKYSNLWINITNGKWGFFDGNGQVVIEPIYDFVEPFVNNRAIVQKVGNWGLINPANEAVFPFKFKSVKRDTTAIGQLFVVGVVKPTAGFVDDNGVMIIPNTFQAARPFIENRAAVKKNNHWNWIDAKGLELSNEAYLEVTDFGNQLALAKKKSGWGLVDINGNEYTSFEYEDILSFEDKATWATLKKRYFVLNYRGTVVNATPYKKVIPFVTNFSFGLAEGAKKYDLIANNGEVIQANKYRKIDRTKGSIAVAAKRKKWGIIDSTGAKMTKFSFKNISVFNDSLCLLKKPNNTYYLYSGLPGKKIKLKFGNLSRNLSVAYDTLIKIQNKDTFWYYNTSSLTKKVKQLEDFQVLSETDLPIDNQEDSIGTNRQRIRTQKGFVFVNEVNKAVLTKAFYRAQPFVNNLALVRENSELNWQLLGDKGLILSPYTFNKVYFSERKIPHLVQIHQKYGIYDEDGKEWIAPEYDFITYLESHEVYLLIKNNESSFMRMDGSVFAP